MCSQNQQYPEHREYVGRPEAFDSLGGRHFALLFALGLREHHRLLDFGCGSLRSGRLVIPYLNPGNYFGIDPNRWLIRAGIEHELGQSVLEVKRPRFDYNGDCRLSVFGASFDFIHAHSVLTHAPFPMIETFFREAVQVLERQGLILATYREGALDHEGLAWVYPELTTFTRATFESVIVANGLAFYALATAHPEQTYFVAAWPETDVQDILDDARAAFSRDLSLFGSASNPSVRR